MKKPLLKRKRLDENIMLFEEWKDSEDYLIQAWFFATNKKVRQWFDDEVLKGFQFDDFQWTASDTYLIYTAHLEFQEKVMEYKLDIILEFEHVKDGKVDEFQTVLSGYTVKDFVMVGQAKDTVKDSDFNATWLASMIQKFKELFPTDDKNIELDTEIANDGEGNNEAYTNEYDMDKVYSEVDSLKKSFYKRFPAMSSNARTIKAAKEVAKSHKIKFQEILKHYIPDNNLSKDKSWDKQGNIINSTS